jgi:CheY-like chemotaxis protein
VVAVTDGPSAVAAADQRLPDVVLMEWVVPRLSGHNILKVLNATPWTADVPCIVFTATPTIAIDDEAQAAGAAIVMEKPGDLNELLRGTAGVVAATSPERRQRRQLQRSVLMLQNVCKQLCLDADAQRQMRAVIDRLQVAILGFDERGRFVAASEAAATLTGWSRAELMAMSLPDDWGVVRAPHDRGGGTGHRCMDARASVGPTGGTSC